MLVGDAWLLGVMVQGDMVRKLWGGVLFVSFNGASQLIKPFCCSD